MNSMLIQVHPVVAAFAVIIPALFAALIAYHWGAKRRDAIDEDDQIERLIARIQSSPQSERSPSGPRVPPTIQWGTEEEAL